MAFAFYKATKTITGCGLKISIAAKADKFNEKTQKSEKGNKGFFFSMFKQTGWNAGSGKNGNGVFKGGAQTNIKISDMEASGIIDAIERNCAWEAYHDSAKQVVQMSLSPAFKKEQNESGKWITTTIPRGYVFTATQQSDNVKTSFAVGLTFGEAVLLREYLKYGLTRVFDAYFSEDVDQAKRYAKNKESAPADTSDSNDSAPPNNAPTGDDSPPPDDDVVF